MHNHKQVGDWRNLEDLNVRNNNLKVLPLEMGNWAKLTRLLAGGNGILEIPAEVRITGGDGNEVMVWSVTSRAPWDKHQRSIPPHKGPQYRAIENRKAINDTALSPPYKTQSFGGRGVCVILNACGP